MTPSRWVQINDLFNVVVDRVPAERQLILDGVRARDPELVDTVEALLQQSTASWKTGAAYERAHPLAVGKVHFASWRAG